ncbi:MAG: hypothetical protein EON85_06325 [Brevundimonas sp.]|nr:MAG: hypothetical protein EON85_06325 [Brevundimonas sp.]
MIDQPVLSDEQRTPPQAVADAAEPGLALRREHKRGGAEIGVRQARQLMSHIAWPLWDGDVARDRIQTLREVGV